MEILLVGKKKGQATTANPSAIYFGSKEKPEQFRTVHCELCNWPLNRMATHRNMLDFFND